MSSLQSACMFEDLSRNKEILPVVAVSAVCVVFFLYHFFTKQKYSLRFFEKISPRSVSRHSLEFISEKLTGFILFGSVPFALFVLFFKIPPQKLGFTPGAISNYRYLVLLLISVAIITPYLLSRYKKKNLTRPELKVSIWEPRHSILAASGWIIYLSGYEFVFRGVLWFVCYDAYGFWSASVINILLYSVVHIPKGKLMTYGAIPLGALFCYLTHKTGSFFPSFLIHSAMSVSNELFSAGSKQSSPQKKPDRKS